MSLPETPTYVRRRPSYINRRTGQVSPETLHRVSEEVGQIVIEDYPAPDIPADELGPRILVEWWFPNQEYGWLKLGHGYRTHVLKACVTILTDEDLAMVVLSRRGQAKKALDE